MKLLEKLDDLIDEIKPIQQPQRFGNKAFRTWYSVVKDVCTSIQLSKSVKLHVFFLTESY